MRAITAIFCFFVFSFAAHAADKPDRGLVFEYLELARFEEVINASMEIQSPQLSQLLSGLPDIDQAEVNKIMLAMREAMGWEAIKDQLADLVANLFTADELKASIAFMKTPLGASATAKGKEFSVQFGALMEQNMLKFMQKYFAQQN
ncbi:MAG: DUF2059 domain-containing protein [Azoarcus sp.]|jgi:hypothetical protein|nr:DUF2059 domain-containing protein [Azoarcus sp.]